MKKLMFNLLAAAVLAAVIAPAVSFADGLSDDELIEQYDKMFDKWLSHGLTRKAVSEQSLLWLELNGIVKRNDLTSNHKLLNNHIQEKFNQVPKSAAKSFPIFLSDEELIERYDKLFDKWLSMGLTRKGIAYRTKVFLDANGLSNVDLAGSHKDVKDHLEQKFSQVNNAVPNQEKESYDEIHQRFSGAIIRKK